MTTLARLLMPLVFAALIIPESAAQSQPLPHALTQMIEAERAFAARALVVGWKQAFLEYFADDAVGFDGGVGPAKEQIRKNPDPPADLQLIWEPRFGDIAASGELGYLTGPVRNVRKSRDNGRPRHSNYASIWKRQRDGSFKVVFDFGVTTPQAVPFAAGFTRAPGNRFSGDYDDTTPPLSAADGILNSGLRVRQADGYRGRLAPGVRFHREGIMPVVGDRAALRWLATQPAYSAIDSRFAEAARVGRPGIHVGQLHSRHRRQSRRSGVSTSVSGSASETGSGTSSWTPFSPGRTRGRLR